MPENFLARFATYFQKLDMFGFRIELSLQKQKRVKSKVGATLTLAIIAACIFSLYLGLSNWANNSQLQIISSGRSFSVPQILNENLTFHYDMNYLNYNIYFALICPNFKNKTLNHEQLKPYLTQKILYGSNLQEVTQIYILDNSLLNFIRGIFYRLRSKLMKDFLVLKTLK